MSKGSKEGTHSPWNDLAGFLLLAVAAFVSLTLASYHPLDPSWNTKVEGERIVIHNYGGILGSYLADFLLLLVGYGAYALPIALLAVTAYLVLQPDVKHTGLRISGAGLLVWSVTLFLAMAAGDVPHLPAWGGIVGHSTVRLSRAYIGNVGTFLVATTAFLSSLVLTAGLTVGGFAQHMLSLGRLPFHLQKKFSRSTKGIRKKMDDILEEEEGALERSLAAIKKGEEPTIPRPIRIAGKDLGADAEAKGAAEGEEKVRGKGESPREVPIVFPKREAPIETALPKFHTVDEPAPAPKPKKVYKLPELGLMDDPPAQELSVDRDELFQNAQLLERKLKDFGVFGKVVEVQPGPVVTMYEFEPAPGVKVNQITRLNDDLALALKALSVRITPIPGKAVIGIEVANRIRHVVFLKEILADDIFKKGASSLTLALGKDISGTPSVANLRSMPHLLVAGATGSGKSVAINSMILSILYRATPDQVRMILVDPKMLELSLYDHIPHLLLPVVTDPRKAAAALRWAVIEMERRYRLMADIGVRNIEGYNKKIPGILDGKEPRPKEKTPVAETDITPPGGTLKPEEHVGPIPYIMIVIDELADLMMVSSHEVEESIIRLAQMARAAGIHLLLATQRPSVDVITGVIKANMPARISFQVASKIDSRTILDVNGAELLLGAGDLLFLPPGTSRLHRIHGAFVTDNEVRRVTDHWKSQGKPDYDHEILKVQAEQAQLLASGDGGEEDEMYRQALELARLHGVASISMIQRKLRIGYNRAARIVERMEEEGYLAPGEVGKPREVRMGRFEA